MNRQWIEWVKKAAGVCALGLIVAACSGEDTETEPDADHPDDASDMEDANGASDGILSVEDYEIELEESFLAPDDRTRAIDSPVIRNEGEEELIIEDIEFVAAPERLEAYHFGDIAEDDVTCQEASDCPEGGICLTQSGACRDRGFEPTPIELAVDDSYSPSVVIDPSDDVVTCPEPPADDESAPEEFCGAIDVGTNATNSTDTGDDGEARIYFVADPSDYGGVFELESTFLAFSDVEPGSSQSVDLEISNGDGNLDMKIHEASISTHGSWFAFEPPLDEAPIPAGETETFALELSPPSDVSAEELNFTTNVSFDTSSSVTEPALSVQVEAAE